MFQKHIIAILLITLGLNFGYAQPRENDQRTRETKIADIVMLLPAKSYTDLNIMMQQLMDIGNVVPDLANGLTEPGANDDTKFRNALSGLAFYASKADAASKKAVASGFCTALNLTKSQEKADFLLICLQNVAGNESVETMLSYLSNERLCDAACRVLVRINTQQSGQALLEALKSSKGKQKISIINALGQAAYLPALESIKADNAEDELQKVSLYAISEIAAPQSEKTMADAVAKIGYKYEKTDAYASYIRYLEKLNAKGNKDIVERASKDLVAKTANQTQIAAKAAALDLYARSAGANALPELTKAMKSNNAQMRSIALNALTNIPSPKAGALLLSSAKTEVDPNKKGEIITVLASSGNRQAMPVITQAMQDKSPVVVSAAINALAKIAGEGSALTIIDAMKKGNANVIETGKKALLRIPGDNMLPHVAAALPTAPPATQAALIEILSAKQASQYVSVVAPLLNSKNVAVKNAAYASAKNFAQLKDIDNMSTLLNSAPAANIGDVKDAYYAAVKNAGTKDEQADVIIGQMKKNPAKQDVFYDVLAKIGGTKGLNEAKTALNGVNKAAAFTALTNWSDNSALPALLSIARENKSGEYFDKALMSYTSKINSSGNTDAQKMLQLSDALELASTNDQKNKIIAEIGKTGTFVGIITAGKYLDDNALKQTAALAVISGTMKYKRYAGPVVFDLLNKAVDIDKAPEAEYRRTAVKEYIEKMKNVPGYVSIFNGKDLTGWKGLVEDPIKRSKMTATELADNQTKADALMRQNWKVENGILVFDGKGYDNLCSVKQYGDFDMLVEWRITAGGDAGIYLRGTPQVQIWDTSLVKVGAQVGSGGLYNNTKHPSKPTSVADNAINEWNAFFIRMRGEKVTVQLNGKTVVDNVTLENYWDRALPIFETEQIELQAHGERVEYRNVYVKEVPRAEYYKVSAEEAIEGFVPMFNGADMSGWIGNLKGYNANEGAIICDPTVDGGGNLYTEKEYSDFVMRFEFKLTPDANNGLGIRTPLEGDAAYAGMELQILDNEALVYKDLKDYQYHGSVYGVIAAKRGFHKPTGEWNVQEVYAKGSHIKITLNGTVILDGDIAKASKNYTATIDGEKHPGLGNAKGHIAFLGHGSEVEFRNLRIKDLSKVVEIAAPKGKSKKEKKSKK